MKQLIGFASQYYTLWEYEKQPKYVTDVYGNHHLSGYEHHYYYLKNISRDIDKVKKLFPNTPIDEDLRGKHTYWVRQEQVNLPNNIFWSGKYKGRLIDEILVSDFQYCLWATGNYNSVNEYVAQHPIYLEYKAEQQRLDDEKMRNAGLAKVGDTITVEFTSNGYNPNDEMTQCWVSGVYNDVRVHILVDGFKQVGGIYPYLMPEINGKTFRTRGKTAEVKISEVISENLEWQEVHQCIRIF